ncbi:MAG: NADH-quinone oxidoreductase subunit L, partial [Bosea sp. (in: a-proteobacteria)]
GSMAFVLLVVAAAFTSFYSWRLYFMTFEGKPRWGGDHDNHGGAAPTMLAGAHHAAPTDHGHDHGHAHTPHESPLVMLIPLGVLAIGAIAAGFAFKGAFIGYGYEAFWKTALFTAKDNHIIHDFHKVPKWVIWSPFVAMVIGFVGAFYCYVLRPDVPAKIAKQHEFLYRFLLNKWYFDELYDWLFVRPAKRLGTFFWKKGDGMVIDGMGPDGISARVVDVTNRVVKLQTGFVYHYAFTMIMGVGGLVTWYLLTRG